MNATPALPLLKVGLPKGSLEEPTLSLFERAGWKIHRHVRNYFPDINDPELTARLCRVQEIPGYLRDGVLDVALTGKDWLLETGVPTEGLEAGPTGADSGERRRHLEGGPARTADGQPPLVLVSDLVYSKVSNRPARWVLAVAGDSPYHSPADLAGKRIATELEGVTRRYFHSLGIPVDIHYSWGATEAKVVEGLADAIVEVTETETTIRAHGLRVIDEVLVTNTVLVASRAAWEDPARRAKIEQIDLLLQGALRAESLVCLKMNAPATGLNAILDLLPSLNSPTVASLRDPAWLSLETVVDAGLVRDLIPRLRAAGAEGILEYTLNKVI